MHKLIVNDDNLREEDITNYMMKGKVLMINSKNQILLGYSYNEYQFIGGTKETNEDLLDTVKREIEEETGINSKDFILKPFACNIGYHKDWPKEGEKQKLEIYYYELFTDLEPIEENMNLTEWEKNGNFELRYIDIDKVEEELRSNALKYGDPHGIASEMLCLLNLYGNMNGR